MNTKTRNIFKIAKKLNEHSIKLSGNKRFDFIENIFNSKEFNDFSKKQKDYFFFVIKNDFNYLYKEINLYFNIKKNINQLFIKTKIKDFEV
tara:strand:+ start:88 stop:360 length:273 start_codon:yes stop_codon:yes gene_type:complete